MWLLLAGALLSGGLSGHSTAQIFTSPAAGQWYPGDETQLERMLEEAWRAADSRAALTPSRKGLRALVVPHAAIQYSGVAAASAYRLLDSPRTVIVLGFSHQLPLAGVAGVDVDAYATPFGEVAVNRKVQEELGFPLLEPEKYSDHSIEVQLPFLQRAAPSASIVPIYVGDLSGKALRAAAAKLARRLKQGDLLIASSDFTHYGESYGYTPFPLDDETPERLRQQALQAFEAIGSMDLEAFDRYLRRTGDTVCGRGPIRLLMETLAILEEETYLEAVDLITSGELTGDFSASVSYGALAFYPSSAYRVGEVDQERLLASARETLDEYLAGARKGAPVPVSERNRDMRQRDGVFVTIRWNGELRGCVGFLQTDTPLWSSVADRTLATAQSDPRFPPLTAADAPVSLEISLLTPLKRLSDWRRFRTGKGAVLLLNGKSSVLLPQVADENGWNSREYLRNLALKAGLASNAYRHSEARLYIFEAQVLAEPQPEGVDGERPAPSAAQ